MVSNTPAKFGGYRDHGSGNIMVLVCHMISQGQLSKGSSNINGRNPSRLVTILPRLVVTGCVVVDIKVLVCHVILQGHVIK